MVRRDRLALVRFRRYRLAVIHHADDASFDDEVLQHRGPVLVEFFTTTCQPCRQIEPWLKSIAAQFSGRLKVVKVDSNKARGVSSFYGVRMAPTLVIFIDGKVMQVIQGKPPAQSRLVSFVQQYL